MRSAMAARCRKLTYSRHKRTFAPTNPTPGANMRRLVLFCTAILCLGFTTAAFAQDPVKVDPKHYTVVSENDQVRILKVHYGAHEKSVMHSHPASVAVP